MKQIVKFTWSLILFIALTFIFSCTAQKRFKRLIKNHPELVKNLDTKVRLKDTVYFNSTIIAPGYTDSVYIVKDTTIYKDRWSVTKSGNLFKFTDYPDTFNVHDTQYIDKEVIVPGQIIDITPGWLKWCLKNKFSLLTILGISILLIFKKKAVDK